MKKYVLILLLVSFTFSVYADGIFKWNIDVKKLSYNIYAEQYDISIIEKEVDSNYGGLKSVDNTSESHITDVHIESGGKKGEFKITQPCLLQITFGIGDERISNSHTIIVPAIPNEEMVLTDNAQSTGYDITGSNFYNQFNEIRLFVEDYNKENLDKDQIFHKIVEYIKTHPDNEACVMMIPIALENIENMRIAALALSPQIKNGRLKQYADNLINFGKKHSIIDIGDFQKIKDYNKIGINGLIIKERTPILDRSKMFKLKSTLNSNETSKDSYYTIDDYYKLLKIRDGIVEQEIPFERKKGYYICNFTTPLYLEGNFSNSSIFRNINFVVDNNKTVNDIIDKQIEEIKKKNRPFSNLNNVKDDRENGSITLLNGGKVDNTKYKAYIYSDGITKIIDEENNWIHFKTRYKIDKYTGEKTKSPITTSEYISYREDILPVAANFVHKGVRIILINKVVIIILKQVQIWIEADNEVLKKNQKVLHSL